jgi:hypothetical protein
MLIPIFDFGRSKRFWIIHSKIKIGEGPPVSFSARPIARGPAHATRVASAAPSRQRVQSRAVESSVEGSPTLARHYSVETFPSPFPLFIPHRGKHCMHTLLCSARPPHPPPESTASERSLCHTTRRVCGALAPPLTPYAFCPRK